MVFYYVGMGFVILTINWINCMSGWIEINNCKFYNNRVILSKMDIL